MATINIDISGISQFIETGYDFVAAMEAGDFQKRAVRAIAEIGRESFYRYADAQSAENPSALHHMYEWGMVGDPNGRLFSVWFPAVAHRQGYVVADARFLKSKVPVQENESTAVDTRRPRVFEDKASFLETGPHSRTITPNAPGGVLAFFSKEEGEMVFRPQTNPVIGQSTSGQFAKIWNEYWVGAGRKETEEKVAEPVRIFMRSQVQRLFSAELAKAKSTGMVAASMAPTRLNMVRFWDRGRPYNRLRTRPEPQKFNSGLRAVYGQWNRLSGR